MYGSVAHTAHIAAAALGGVFFPEIFKHGLYPAVRIVESESGHGVYACGHSLLAPGVYFRRQLYIPGKLA